MTTAPHQLAGNAAFAAGLLDPDMPEPAFVADAMGNPAPRRYGVYRNNVVISLMEGMRAAFPAVAAIMGQESFDKVARNYIFRHPPRSPMMQALGRDFSDFLGRFPPLAEARYLADLARLERLFLDALHAADAEPLAPADLAALAASGDVDPVFSSHPALGLIASRWPVASLLSFREGPPAEPVDLATPEYAMVTRPQYEVMVTAVDEASFDLATRLAAGETLGEAAGEVMERHPGFDLGGAIALFLQAGAFRRPYSTE